MEVRKQTMDGNEAAAYASFAFTEVAAIYPITPSSPMAEFVDTWAAKGMKNAFGDPVKLVEMQSEAGAIGAVHGAAEAGALATTYTSSQGLLLMIPAMYRLAGQLKAGVIHVAARSVASHGYSIFAEHSDVMACRQTGFAMLSSGSVQEAMDLGAAAHLASIEAEVPFMHFFDGFRTSHELQKIELLDYQALRELIDRDTLERFRKKALNPERPNMHTPGQTPDLYFQARESINPYYDRLPQVVERCLDKINGLTGRNYKLFNYYGAPDADTVIVALGSVCGTVKETAAYLNAQGYKTGVLQVHLYRPFSAEHFLRELPDTVRTLVVLDRTKEPGAFGDPLYEDVCALYANRPGAPRILAGRYGIGGKNTAPAHIKAIFDNAMAAEPMDHFTVGITDDLTGRSLPVGEKLDTSPKGMTSCKFWGLGSDGTVGANKNSIKIIGDHTDKYVQAYFEYDGKKFGGVTKSHLRFGDEPIDSAYYVDKADFVACHNQASMLMYDTWSDLKPGGVFLLNTSWKVEELERRLPAQFKAYAARNSIRFFVIDASGIARDMGMSKGANTILQAAFFKLADILPLDDAVEYMKQYITKSYASKGEAVVRKNHEAVDKGISMPMEVSVPAAWASCVPDPEPETDETKFVRELMRPMLHQRGGSVPVSAFAEHADGAYPSGTSQYEKRGIAEFAPQWVPENCLQCNLCSLVCPHAAVRPVLLDSAQKQNAPESLATVPAKGKPLEGYQYAIVVDSLDCTGCGSCANVCPAKNKALRMVEAKSQSDKMSAWEYAVGLPDRESPMGVNTVKGSQFQRPLLEFPGACPGCGESPYVKLATQLFGDRMYVATATGCSAVWSTEFPCFPYCKNQDGHGPASSNSLFENNGEFGLGMALGVSQLRDCLKRRVTELARTTSDEKTRTACAAWLDGFDDSKVSGTAGKALCRQLETVAAGSADFEAAQEILAAREHLSKKSVWMVGGDGWAYDIGYGGVDHVLSMQEDVNILVLDTEVYSNTGGQASKATPKGAKAQFAASGRKSEKKDLGRLIMQRGDVYVAQVAMGADPAQLLKAMIEAESYKGPSVIIAYAPCVSHGIKCGMQDVMGEMRRAVESGYWLLYRYDPRRAATGEALILDSREPTGDVREFMLNENRFASLAISMPEESKRLIDEAVQETKRKYETFKTLSSRQ